MLSLAEAVKTWRIQDFIVQKEGRHIGPIDRTELNRRIMILIKAKQSEGQTSRSASRDGSTGKRTRQGNGRRTLRLCECA